MTNLTHTAEPWRVFKTPDGTKLRGIGESNGAGITGPLWGDDKEEMANAERIVACVNALAGLNPSAIKDVIEAANNLLAGLYGTDKHDIGLPLHKALTTLKGE